MTGALVALFWALIAAIGAASALAFILAFGGAWIMFRSLRLLGFFLLGVLLVAVPIFSYAFVSIDAAGNYTGPVTAAGPMTQAVEGTGAARSVSVSQAAELRLGGGTAASKAAIGVVEKVSAKTLGGLVLGAARGTIQGYVAAEIAGALLDRAGVHCDIATGCHYVAGSVAETIAALSGTHAAIIKFQTSTGWQAISAPDACYLARDTSYPIVTSSNYQSLGLIRCRYTNSHGDNYWKDIAYMATCESGYNPAYTSGSVAGTCTGTAKYCDTVAGWTLSGSNCTRPACPAGQMRSETGLCISDAISDAIVQDKLAAAMTNAELNDYLQKAYQQEVAFAHDTARITVTGPATVTSPAQVTKETTVKDGVATVNNITKQTTYNINYAGNTITYNAVNTTTRTDAAGNVISTTEETLPKEDLDSASVVDSPIDDVPKLYERKYPNGLQGVWTDQKTALMATPLASLQSVFAPSIAGGTCPSWTFNANIGPKMNFGTGVISPPCWLWTALKAIVIVSALFLARALVFGG